jgi:hypothetical protein
MKLCIFYGNFDYCNGRKIAGTEESDSVNYRDMHSRNF